MVDRLSGDRTNVFPFAGQAAAIVKVINILNLVAKKEPGKKKFCMSASDLGLFALMPSARKSILGRGRSFSSLKNW